MGTRDYTPHEMMAILLARDLADSEIGTGGVGALIPMAAMMMARQMHAPNLTIGGELYVNPEPPIVAHSIFEDQAVRRIEAVEGFPELFGYSHKGLDFFFHNGIQIDQYGNINLHIVGGTFEQPKFRGPGVANVSYATNSKRFYLYPTTHTPRRLVEKVAFVSVAGNLQGPESRRAAGLDYGGPKLCVTPLCVFDFDPQSLRMRLKSVHPWSSVEEVLEQTGFTPVMPEKVEITVEPTPEELRVLREEVDPHGFLRE